VEALPEVGRVPLHPPEATQVVAFVADQLRVDDLPNDTVLGLAENVKVGAGAAGVTSTVNER